MTQKGNQPTGNMTNATSGSYARALQQEQCPTKEQAIILDSIEGLTVREYALAIGSIVDPRNIRFVSRTSHGRVCLYLSSKEIADNLTDNNTKVKIGEHVLEIRPLISKSKRIIISNVPPIVPAAFLEKELSKLSVRTASRITSIRAGLKDEGFAHILSFRRQVFVPPEDVDKLPVSLEIDFEGTVYWIYFSTQKLTCFICKEEGHLARHCVSQGIEENVYTQTDSQLSAQLSQVEEDSLIESKNTIDIQVPKPTQPEPKYPAVDNNMLPPTLKRVISSASSSSSNSREGKKNTAPRADKLKHTAKKKKGNLSVNEILEQIKQAVNNEPYEGHPITLESLASFLESSYGSSTIYSDALIHTQDIDGLCGMLTDIYQLINSRSLKAKITQIKKVLQSDQAEVQGNVISSEASEVE